MMAQLVEVQATLQVLIELQKLMVSGGFRDVSDLDHYCKSLMDQQRRQALYSLKHNVKVAKKMLHDNGGKVM